MQSQKLQELYLSLEHLSCWTEHTQEIVLQLIKKKPNSKKSPEIQSNRENEELGKEALKG